MQQIKTQKTKTVESELNRILTGLHPELYNTISSPCEVCTNQTCGQCAIIAPLEAA